uniref:Uncharacterized protein n=1 Tax=Oryza glumipatula TaxID=40148 RepID=A0A0D9YL23_9ORYZ
MATGQSVKNKREKTIVIDRNIGIEREKKKEESPQNPDRIVKEKARRGFLKEQQSIQTGTRT